MDTLGIVAVFIGLLLVQAIRAIGALRLRFLTASLSEMAKNTSEENERRNIEAKMRGLVAHMRGDSFVETAMSHSRSNLHLIIAGSYAVLFGILLFGLVAVYASIEITGSLVIDSLVSMYIGSGRFYLDMANNYMILVVLILYLSVILWPVVYIHSRLYVARRVLKGDKDVSEPAPIDRYGLAFTGIAPVLCVLLLALAVHFVNYGMDLARYEEQVSVNLDSGNLDSYVDGMLDDDSLADDFQRKLFVGVLLGRLLEEGDEDRSRRLGEVVCEKFGRQDNDVSYFLNLGFRERIGSTDLACIREGREERSGGVPEDWTGLETEWREIDYVPEDADQLMLGTPERAVEVEANGVRWFYFDAPESGPYTFLAEGVGFGAIDSVMALYSENGELSLVEFSDDVLGRDPSISTLLDVGVRYYIGVSGFLGESGLVNVTVKLGL